MTFNLVRKYLVLVFLVIASASHAEEVFHYKNLGNDPTVWSFSPGAEKKGNELAFAAGAYANFYTGISPTEKRTYKLSTKVSFPEPGAGTTLTFFLYRESDPRVTQNVSVTNGHGGHSEKAEVSYTTASHLEVGWKLGVQILSGGTMKAWDIHLTSSPAAAPLILEGKFGHAEIDPIRPGLVNLTLRRPDGTLEPHSLLSDAQWPWLRGGPEWATGAYTYVRDLEGTLYESRLAEAEYSAENGGITLRGITLKSSSGTDPIATEEWLLRPEGDALIWTVKRTWLKTCKVRLEGTPALFMSMRPLAGTPTPNVPNGLTSTFWVQPDQLDGCFDPLYRPAAWTDVYRHSRNNVVWLTEPNQWAIHKLFGNWDNTSDLRVDADGGHLYRRGFYGWVTETGITVNPSEGNLKEERAVEVTTLRISPVDKTTTGHQLSVQLPDKQLQQRLSSFYSSLLNGGTINDQLNYNFGNETDGWYYAGSVWMQGLALNAGLPASGALAEKPYNIVTAFRNHLAAVIGASGPDGRSLFGYNAAGTVLDDNVHSVLGMLQYYLHSGDLAFVRQQLPLLEKRLEIYLSRRNADGLFDMGEKGHQYYDAVPISGVSGYHNAFFYKALRDMADLQLAVGDKAKFQKYSATADEIKTAYNKVLWAEDAPGGPRYLDWITHTGEKVSYCSDVSQFPALAFGIASDEQAKKLLATIDARIEELKVSHNYSEMTSLSAYWPQPPHLQFSSHTFPIYMNGGGFFAQTYWEIVGRARYGDKATAFKRLQRFAEGSKLYNWVGTNWVQINGEIGGGGNDEPYLSDMVVIPAALINGILGIHPSVNQLEVSPAMPGEWTEASANVLYKGAPVHVAIADNGATVTPLTQPHYQPPLELTWKVGSPLPNAWDMRVQQYFNSGQGWTADPTLALDNGEGLRIAQPNTSEGTYASVPFDWNQPTQTTTLAIRADLNRGRVESIIETSNDAFKSVEETFPHNLADGKQIVQIAGTKPARYVRLRLKLIAPDDRSTTPVVHDFTITGIPVL